MQIFYASNWKLAESSNRNHITCFNRVNKLQNIIFVPLLWSRFNVVFCVVPSNRLYVELWQTLRIQLKRDCIKSLPNEWQNTLDFAYFFHRQTKNKKSAFIICTRDTKICNLTSILKHRESHHNLWFEK